MTPTNPDLCAKWDQRYRSQDRPALAAAVLVHNAHLLPTVGRALDLACGLGANALFLARRGLAVAAWDLSPVAIGRLRADASGQGLILDAQVRDVVADPPDPASFDVILVAHFLDRGLCPAIATALSPGGLLFYQTFTREAVSDLGPPNPAYRLGRNELLGLFPALVVRAYREEGTLGDTRLGLRDLALLVVQRPPAGERTGEAPAPPPHPAGAARRRPWPDRAAGR
jgi:tellurite methyltransferase